MKDIELEVKFLVRDLASVENHLKALGAKMLQARILEVNLRFDTPEGELSKSFKALRLRKDHQARLTYKGPSETQEGVRVRTEIEFIVDDFDAARNFLLALGFQIFMIYEKYRSIYNYQGVSITLDELPYGNFVEIEGPDPASIQQVNRDLGLDWECKIPDSYLMLFNRICQKEGFQNRDLSFEDFTDRDLAERVLEIKPADIIF